MLLHKKFVFVPSPREKIKHAQVTQSFANNYLKNKLMPNMDFFHSLISIFQRNIVPLGKLLDTAEQCTSLVRLGIVTPSDAAPFKWTADELTRRLLVLCKKLPHLIAFFSVLNIPKSHSVKATKQVLQHMTPERPSFCADIQVSDKNRLDYESNLLPLIHREILVHFNSRVGVLPHDFKSSLL